MSKAVTVKVIKKAWTEEAWDYDGEYYKVPYPYKEGIRRWPVADWTRQYGAPGDIGPSGDPYGGSAGAPGDGLPVPEDGSGSGGGAPMTHAS